MSRELRHERELRLHLERTAMCSHPSWKCLVCKKAEDHIMDEQKAEISILKDLLSKEDLKRLYYDREMLILVHKKVTYYNATKGKKL